VLHDQAKWYQDLASSLRFTVAALLIQHHIKGQHFLSEHVRIGDLLRHAGLRSSGFHHTMTVLIMLISPMQPGVLDVERIKAIHQAMKRFHWWLTGPEDLPACAALAYCPGSAAEIVSRTEACYLLLKETGLSRGDHLQMAANLLPLSGLDADVVVGRYRALKHRIEERNHDLVPADYEAIAVLCLLDHAPDPIVDRLLSVGRELELLQAEVGPVTNLIIAADLVCLDLMRFDRAMRPVHDAHGASTMLRSLHLYHLATAAMLSHIEADIPLPMMGLPGAGWPAQA
jgi:hypothetical protein